MALILALALSAGSIFKRPQAIPAPPPAAIPTAELTPEPPPTVLEQTEDMGQEYIDRFVFLGDSTTYGLAFYDILPHTQVWTPASGTLSLNNCAVETVEYYDGQEAARSLSIEDAAARRQPEYLLITLGLNGIAYLNEDDFKSCYISLVQAVQAASPGTKIICNSVYPVIDAQVSTEIGNDRIDAANLWIEAVAAETGTRYLNTHDALADESDGLRAEYCNGDGIHLGPGGFDAVLQCVRTHGWQ